MKVYASPPPVEEILSEEDVDAAFAFEVEVNVPYTQVPVNPTTVLGVIITVPKTASVPIHPFAYHDTTQLKVTKLSHFDRYQA